MKYPILVNSITLLATLLLLSACSNPTPTAMDVAMSPTPSPSSVPTENMKPDKTETHGGQGGQVVEAGAYHLELLPLKENSGFHFDFYLQNGIDHSPIANAIVTGKVQFPDGTQKDIDFTYSDQDKHYEALLSTQVVGDYRFVILSDINGEKINGRFNFKY